jgi:hypothetical protein
MAGNSDDQATRSLKVFGTTGCPCAANAAARATKGRYNNSSRWVSPSMT